jgi:peptide/nickel transport system substrate-binding protein
MDAIALDAAVATDSESLEVAELISEGLVRWRPGTTEIEPALALSWDVSADGLIWIFHLRPEVKFHDGTPMNAASVVFSFDRQRNREGFRHWQTEFSDVQAIRSIDDATVEFKLSRPFAPFLANLAMPAASIVSPTAATLHGDKIYMQQVGTGPFKFSSWSHGDRIVVERYDGYWGQPPFARKVIFTVVADANQRVIQLETGAIDIAAAILPHERFFVQLHPELRLSEVSTNNVAYVAMNIGRPGLRDVRVRQALRAAIDLVPVTKVAYQGLAEPAWGPLPPLQWSSIRDGEIAYDPARARTLLQSAIADGVFDPTRPLQLLVPSQPRAYVVDPVRVATMLQAGFASIGVTIELKVLPFTELRAAAERGEHDMCLVGWVGDNGDPDNFLYGRFGSDNTAPPHPQNFSFLRDASIDSDLRLAQQQADSGIRTTTYQRIQRRIFDLAPWIPIAHSRVMVALRRDITDIVMSPTGHVLFALLRRVSP